MSVLKGLRTLELKLKSIASSLPPAVKSLRPSRAEFEGFLQAVERYLSRIDENETEENHKTHLIEVLKTVYPSSIRIEPQERIDCVIRRDDKDSPPLVLIETKTQRNRSEMIAKSDINRKALHESILYYMRERRRGNISISHIIICSTFEFYIFEAKQFERTFFRNREFHKKYIDWAGNKTSDQTTDFFYTQIASPFIASSKVELEATFFDLRSKTGDALLPVYKALSAHNLLRDDVENDSNSLNKGFYDELLYILGLEEARAGSKKIIQRREKGRRAQGSLLEMAITELEHIDRINDPELINDYGANRNDRIYAVALELCLTWINRLLFLKLLEAQLVRFHDGSDVYEFLNERSVRDFDDLSDLFFLVLALEQSERPERVSRYEMVPYLNSSLFERTHLEQLLSVSALPSREVLGPFSKTVLRDDKGRKLKSALPTLTYILRFFDAYDFGSSPGGEIKEDDKTLISASVLGLIFEKINGYRDGAVFTPGQITMNMSRRVIEAAAIDAFQEAFPEWKIHSITDISNNIIDRSAENILRLNEIVDQLKICDPAVGSGHYLVSCLNELIALKSRLGILADSAGARISDYQVDVDNDELVVINADSDKIFSYRVQSGRAPARLQQVQRALFEEKRKLIENCLFGVDINRNSVRICQLRLWIELLKNAFYRQDGTLETLPNIDINIKTGDSLLSRFTLDQSLSSAFRSAGLTVGEYRRLVGEYKNTREKSVKRELERRLSSVKQSFQKEALSNLTKSINAEIAALRAREAQLGLFEDSESEEAARNSELDEARASIAKLEVRREQEIKRKTYQNALEWRFEFPEILSSREEFEGFDIIIGNPPYGVPVKGERREIITKIVGKVPDFEIYYMFLNQGRRLLKSGGRLSFIIPNMLLSNVYAQSYRLALLDEWREVEIDDLTDFRVFSDAVVHNIIFMGRKGAEREGVLFRKTGEADSISDYLAQPQELASKEVLSQSNRNWGLVFRLAVETASALSEIRNGCTSLASIFQEVSQGLIPYDKHQGQDEATIKGRIYHKSRETSSTSHWINGEDVKRFSMQWNGKEFIEYGTHLANPRQPKFFQKPRVLVREITNPRVYAAYTEEEAYNDPAIINILGSRGDKFPLKALEAILNSKLATFYHFNSSPKALKGAFPKILVDDINEFPLPVLEEDTGSLTNIARIADELRLLLRNGVDREELSSAEERLDLAVYDLYDLSAAVVETIELYFSAPEVEEVDLNH